MSTVKTKNVQVGTDGTASNNFTIYVPGTPDGTVRIGNGDAGAVTDAVTINSSGAVTLANNLSVTGTSTLTGNVSVNGANISTQPSFRNLIINGDMRIDQRNAGASVTPVNNGYTLDRFQFNITQTSKLTAQQNAGAVTPPTGFTNYLGITSTSAYSLTAGDSFVVRQKIEGNNIAHLGWGTANAKTVTLSFWVRSSLTGTFGGSLKNASSDAYPFSYTISSANTWEQKSITITGSTSGTWATDNTTGMFVQFGLGAGSTFSATAGVWNTSNSNSSTGATSVVGTNGATFYLTGVQLEAGTTATDFENLPYDVEFARCQRYYYKIKGTGGGCLFATGWNGSTTVGHYSITLPVTMRTYPTALETSGTATHYQIVHTNTATACNGTPTYGGETSPEMARVNAPVASGLTAGQGSGLRAGDIAAYLAWSAEL